VTRFETLCAASALIVTTSACDALVGGTCADGYIVGDDGCVVATDQITAPPQIMGEGADGGRSAGGADPEGGGDPAGSGGFSEGGGGPINACPPDTTACGSACVDLDSNPYHCGSCFNACPTETCTAGTCDGTTLGHVAVVGMSYQQDHAPSRHLLGNAVFLPTSLDVQLLSYEGYGHPAAIKNVGTILASEAALRGRSLTETVATDPEDVAEQLATASYDVFLIHDQALAPAGHGSAFADATADALASFGQQGGVIVALAASNQEMPTLLTETGLLTTAALIPIEGATVVKSSPTDALAIGVASPFSAKVKTSAIVITEPPSSQLSFVFTDDSAAANPVVIHKVVVP